MEFKRFSQCVCLVLLLSSLSQVLCQAKKTYYYQSSTTTTYTEKPLVARPDGSTYKTLLSVDGGGLRLLMATMVIIEVEQSIKRYLLENPYYLPHGSHITSVDDFDINLADYFDFITATSAGAWVSLYLASRGGQGTSSTILDDPDIVARYGSIPAGSAEGLRVLFREYATIVYPPEAVNASAGTVFDLTNPEAPGVLAPVYPLDGIETTMNAFLGQTTLADCDTSVLVTSYDLISGFTTLFLANLIGDRPTTSAAKMVPRSSPKTTFVPDLVFQEGDYFLADLATASSAAPNFHPAKPVNQIGNEAMEFLLIDGAFPIEYPVIPASFICAAETGDFDFESIAIMSVGTGRVTRDMTQFANAGLAGWLEGGAILNLYITSGLDSQSSLIDYIFYSNPNTKPYQYLRIDTEAFPDTTDIGLALSVLDQAAFLDLYEELGAGLGETYRGPIDLFVKTFIFG